MRVVGAAADLLLGARCHGCGTPGWGVCADCRARLATYQPFATRPNPCPDGFPLTVATAAYDDLHRRLIIAHKERQALALTRLLGDRLALSVRGLLTLAQCSAGRVALVPVPSAARAVRERGFDATAAMTGRAAHRLSGHADLEVRKALVQRESVRDQAGLTAGQRQANLRGGLRVRGRLDPGIAVIVVDDLVTTGASLTEATRLLTAAGAEVLGAATIAATQRWTR